MENDFQNTQSFSNSPEPLIRADHAQYFGRRFKQCCPSQPLPVYLDDSVYVSGHAIAQSSSAVPA